VAQFGYIEHREGMKSRVHPKYKTRYSVTNWREYGRGLMQRSVRYDQKLCSRMI